jgi:hypothetical protein
LKSTARRITQEFLQSVLLPMNLNGGFSIGGSKDQPNLSQGINQSPLTRFRPIGHQRILQNIAGSRYLATSRTSLIVRAPTSPTDLRVRAVDVQLLAGNDKRRAGHLTAGRSMPLPRHSRPFILRCNRAEDGIALEIKYNDRPIDRSQLLAAFFNQIVDPTLARAISAGTHPPSRFIQ